MSKPFAVKFALSAKILAIMFLCYEYRLPLSILISFYELYREDIFFAFRAFNCCGKLKITDNALTNAIQEAHVLYKEILRGVTVLHDISRLKMRNPKNEPIPDPPVIDTSKLSAAYKNFVENYLLVNISDIYAEEVVLKLSSEDLYQGASN